MAIATSELHRSLRGAVGDFIFRTYNGKTVVSLRPVYKNETNTEGRRKARGHFRDATNFASIAMANTKQKAYYKQKARQLKLPNAYTAAVTDFMRKAKANAVTRSSFAAKKDDMIQVIMSKAGFNFKQITVTACTAEGEVLTTRVLTKEAGDKTFKFILPDDWPDFALLKILSDELGGGKTYGIRRDEILCTL